jgi:hypothetical protein
VIIGIEEKTMMPSLRANRLPEPQQKRGHFISQSAGSIVDLNY